MPESTNLPDWHKAAKMSREWTWSPSLTARTCPLANKQLTPDVWSIMDPKRMMHGDQGSLVEAIACSALETPTTHSVSMETIECQLNDIISSPGSKFATRDISNMHLKSALPEAEHIRFCLDLIPQAIINQCELASPATKKNGFIHTCVDKAWCGLKQAGKIVHDDLVNQLAEAGHKKHGLAEGRFRHNTRDIDFTLAVDDFLIRCTKEANLAHLTQAIEKCCTLKVNPEAKQCCVGIQWQWDCVRRSV